MNLMISMRGEPEQHPFLPEIAALGAGIELGSYGLMGIRSQANWEMRLAWHKAIRAQFQGPVAIHGPFLGMDYAHIDYLILEVVQRRLDMIFDAAAELKAGRVVLHGSHKPEINLFKLNDAWLKGCAAFWRREIQRWALAGVEIVLENDLDKEPDPLIALVDEVDNPYLGLCLDIGHQHAFSDLDAVEWVCRMDTRLYHIHLHDNDRTGDLHWRIGRGTIDFEPFYAAIQHHVPGATISLEVEDAMETKMRDLRSLAARFATNRTPDA